MSRSEPADHDRLAILLEGPAHALAPQAEHAPPGAADHDRRRRRAGTALRAERGLCPLLSPRRFARFNASRRAQALSGLVRGWR